MLNSLSWFVGLRYVRARSHKFFVSFITWVSLLSVCLGVAALIVGRLLAQMRGVGLGDPVMLLVPTTNADGVPEPRLREYRVAGVFESDQPEYDSALMLAALTDVRALLPDPDARMALHVNYTDAI